MHRCPAVKGWMECEDVMGHSGNHWCTKRSPEDFRVWPNEAECHDDSASTIDALVAALEDLHTLVEQNGLFHTLTAERARAALKQAKGDV